MQKMLVCALMFGAMVLASSSSSALAGGAKKDKDTKSKTSKNAAGYIEIGEGKDGKFRFFVRNSEGKMLSMSGPTGFATKKDAEAAIEELKEVISTAKVSMKKAPDKK